MQKILFLICLPFLFLLLINCSNSDEQKEEKAIPKKDTLHKVISSSSDSLAPVMLDDIHYYTLDRQKTNLFFRSHFKARAMAQQAKNPFEFIDFLQINPEQSTINISAQGPFPGMRVVDPKRWERKVIQPSPTLPPMYGVYWLAFATESLEKSLQDLKKKGVEIISEKIAIPLEPEAKAAAIWGPDYTMLVLVERKNLTKTDAYRIDHLQLLVKKTSENIRFFEDVFSGKLISRKNKSASIQIGKHTFIISEAEELGLKPEKVAKRNPKEFRPCIDHLGFQYANISIVAKAVEKKGYKFFLNPLRMKYYDKETPYTFAILFSPDSLQCEMYMEEGRIGPRTIYLE